MILRYVERLTFSVLEFAYIPIPVWVIGLKNAVKIKLVRDIAYAIEISIGTNWYSANDNAPFTVRC